MNYIKYVTHKYDEKHKQVCENRINYSEELFIMLLSCTNYKDLINNTFLELQRPFLINIYFKARSLQWSMRRFILKYRKKLMISCNQYDLSLYDFTDPVELIIVNKKYTFQRQELYKLIYSSLLNADVDLISTPIPVKNPYTGIPFTKNMLYIICDCIKLNPLFYYYRKCYFNCNDFLLKYEGLIRTHLIEKIVNEYTITQIKHQVKEMLEDITLFNFITENYEPIVKLNNIPLNQLKPLLFHYYFYNYSLNPYQRSMEYKELLKKLIVLRK
jgi:hypothetical protein